VFSGRTLPHIRADSAPSSDIIEKQKLSTRQTPHR